MSLLIIVFFTAFVVVLYSTPSLIKVAVLKRLIDHPSEERKIHTRSIPTIGGIIIFAATIFAYTLWYSIEYYREAKAMVTSVNEFKLIIATSLVLFFVGIKDDIIGTAPVKKLFAHILVAMILVLMGDLRISSLHGIFGAYTIPYWASVFLSIFTYVVVVNSFNLIDGVDGLAAGVGFITSTSFGIWFVSAGEFPYAALSFALSGALLGFLVFNFAPAKIFMGDSGSLIVGLFVCILAIKLIEFPSHKLNFFWLRVSKPVFVIAILAYPLLDTLRSFTIRTFKGISPFMADRNHIHHKLLDNGYSHQKTAVVIYIFSILNLLLALASYYLPFPTLSLILIVVFSFGFLFTVIRLNGIRRA